jgi:hypothetical protein
MRVDVDSYDEMMSEIDPEDLPPEALRRPSGDYEYEAAEAQFKRQKLDEVARVTVDALVQLGASEFRVRYDGGYDEGFSHSEFFVIKNQQRPALAVADELAGTSSIAAIRAAITQSAYRPSGEMSDSQMARFAIDQLAHELATLLLGRGYGTGEYSLYGAFTANLRTGQLVDDKQAAKPDSLK